MICVRCNYMVNPEDGICTKCGALICVRLTHGQIFEQLVLAFAEVRLNFNDEAGMQAAVYAVLNAAKVGPVLSEYRFDAHNRVDFWLPESGVVVETKVRCGNGELLRQLKRYADLPVVHAVVLIQQRKRELPPMLSGKPVYQVTLWGNGLG